MSGAGQRACHRANHKVAIPLTSTVTTSRAWNSGRILHTETPWLTASEYLARLPDRATNMFWGDAPLGDTSLTAGASSLASWHFVQLASVQRMRRNCWACREGLGWSQKSMGGERGGVRSKWAEKGGEVVKNAESVTSCAERRSQKANG